MQDRSTKNVNQPHAVLRLFFFALFVTYANTAPADLSLNESHMKATETEIGGRNE